MPPKEFSIQELRNLLDAYLNVTEAAVRVVTAYELRKSLEIPIEQLKYALSQLA